VVEKITSSFPEFDWVNDRKIQDRCSLRRPDLLLDLGDQVIIVEIDENRHDSYKCSCENKRIMEISKDLDYRPCILFVSIRINIKI
jgi:hypothetical protein